MAETWVISETPNIISGVISSVNFVSNNTSYQKLEVTGGSPMNKGIRYYYSSYQYDVVWTMNGWANQSYRALTFEGSVEVDAPQLYAWFNSPDSFGISPNAVKQEQPSGKTLTVTYNGVDIIDSAEVSGDVAVTYDNQTIVTLSDGTKTLKCNGKVMKSDVVLGGKTLKCSGKRMVSDVVVKVEGEPEPSGETWVINEIPEILSANSYDINFTSNEQVFSELKFVLNPPPPEMPPIYTMYYDNTAVWYINWNDQAYRTVYFPIPPTGQLRTWLQENANLQ